MTIEALYKDHSAHLIAFLRKYADPELAEEIASRVWMKILESGAPETRNPFAYLCWTARGLLSDYRKLREETVSAEQSNSLSDLTTGNDISELIETIPTHLQSLAQCLSDGGTVSEWAESQGLSRAAGYLRLEELRRTLS